MLSGTITVKKKGKVAASRPNFIQCYFESNLYAVCKTIIISNVMNIAIGQRTLFLGMPRQVTILLYGRVASLTKFNL